MCRDCYFCRTSGCYRSFKYYQFVSFLANDVVIFYCIVKLSFTQVDGRIDEVVRNARQTRQSDQRVEENSDCQQKTTARHTHEPENGSTYYNFEFYADMLTVRHRLLFV